MRICQLTLLGILFSLTLNNAYATATLLTNYPKLLFAVENADDVKGIIHFDKCTISNENNQDRQIIIRKKFDRATTRFNFTEYLHSTIQVNKVAQDTITTSFKTYEEQPTGEIWTLIAALTVFDDNSVTLHLDYYDQINNKKQLEQDWQCDISNGNDDNGLFLYDFP
jgi:hypothetical protein